MHRLVAAGPALDVAALRDLYRTVPGVPLLRMNFAATLDGAVTLDGLSTGIGGPADRQVFGVIRTVADGIMVGAGTLRAEEYRPVRPSAERRAWRVAAGLDEYPRLIVVSARLDLDPEFPALAEAPVRPIIITHAGSDPDRRERLSTVAEVRVHGADGVDLEAALDDLRRAYGLHHVVCEGGPMLFGSLHAAGLVDEVCLTIAPLVAGPGAGRIIAAPLGDSAAAAVASMALVHVLQSDDRLLLRYAKPA